MVITMKYTHYTICHACILHDVSPQQAADSFTPPASPLMPASSSSTPDGGSGVSEEHPVGSMVWGKLPGYEWWPGVIISYSRDKEGDSATGEVVDGGGVQVWVKWYGENNLSQVR